MAVKKLTPVTDIVMVCQDREMTEKQELEVAFPYLLNRFPRDYFEHINELTEPCPTEHNHVHHYFKPVK